jgi:hypothetical protein
MWWNQPRLKDYPPLLPHPILDVAVRAYALVEVGGLSGCGPERGRNFEKLFYDLCAKRGLILSERAGAKTLAEQRSASGFLHEVDGATRSAECVTHWELKHLTSDLDKNELLVFNGKSLDFLYGSNPLFSKIPLLRFLLSGRNVGQDSRVYSVLWGIALVEPGRLPLPLLYEAVARSACDLLRPGDREAVKHDLRWACRPLQRVLKELNGWVSDSAHSTYCGPNAKQHAKGVLEVQESIGLEVADHLSDTHPDWIDDIATETWNELGGW